MSQFNTLIVHVIRLKDLPVRGRNLDAYASLGITGTTKLRSKVTTQFQRIDESGSCQWDEHLEFQLDECFTDLQINVNHKSKLGASETLASIAFKLAEMPHMQTATWFKLHKKNNSEKSRGMLLMSFEFKNTMGALSVSQTSLNTIGKENKLDKLKKRINFGRKKAKIDAQSMFSVSLSRRSSICSNSSALLAFSPAVSPAPPDGTNLPHQDETNVCLPPDPAHYQQNTNNLMTPGYRDEKRLSLAMEDSISQCSDVGGSDLTKKHGKKFAARFRQKADQLLNIGSNRKSVEEFNDNAFINHALQYNQSSGSRPQSITSSSGFASVVSPGNLESLNESSSKDYLLNVIGQLRKELQLKEHRIHDLEEYTGLLLSKIIEKNPELLQVN